MQMKTISFIGAGNMANSIIRGLLAHHYDPNHIYATNRNIEKLTTLQQQCGIHVTTNNIEAAQQADILVLAVKPQDLAAVCAQLQAIIGTNMPLILSLITGKTIATLEAQLQSKHLPIVRCVPNTPAALGYGITAGFVNAYVSEVQKENISMIFNAIGSSVWLDDETQLNAVTAVSGCGPAYFFYLMENFIKAAIAQGLPESIAKSLVKQTALGAAKMALASPEPLSVLRRHVASPGGSTEQGIKVLQQHHIAQILQEVIDAANKRATELAE